MPGRNLVAKGVIFVSLADRPPDFIPFEEEIVRRLKPHGLERTKICQTLTYHVKANWKVVLENSRECYHCVALGPTRRLKKV